MNNIIFAGILFYSKVNNSNILIEVSKIFAVYNDKDKIKKND